LSEFASKDIAFRIKSEHETSTLPCQPHEGQERLLSMSSKAFGTVVECRYRRSPWNCNCAPNRDFFPTASKAREINLTRCL